MSYELVAGKPCHYCGLPAQTVDHVIPQSLIEQYKLSDPAQMNELLGHNRVLTVPACSECNKLASDSYQDTLAERTKVVKSKLRKRYKNLLRMPEWTDQEIADMGRSMQDYIRAGIVERRLIQQRLDW
jgi:hypothetical protein